MAGMSRWSASWSTSSMILSVVGWISECWKDVSRVLSVLSLNIFNLVSDVTSQMNQKRETMIALLGLRFTRPLRHQWHVGLLHLARGLVDHCSGLAEWGELAAKVATGHWPPGPRGLIDRVGTTEWVGQVWLEILLSLYLSASKPRNSFI